MLLHAVCRQAEIGPRVTVGPVRLPAAGTSIAADAHIGTYVELKKSHVGAGAKVPHLTYVGDATIGAGSNIGAGTIFANYDGAHKHRTEVGENAFVGSNTVLVAPVDDRRRRLHGGRVGDHRGRAGRRPGGSQGTAAQFRRLGAPQPARDTVGGGSDTHSFG